MFGLKRKIVVFGVMVVVLAGLLAMAVYRRNMPHKGEVAAKGKPAPEFTLTDLAGRPVALSSLRGKAVLLNFWATWCPPCKQEIPWFVEMQKRYGAQGLQVVGVNMDDAGDLKDVARFGAENGVNYPILIGQEQVAQQYGGIDYLPTTFYIDRKGVVVERVFGQPTGRDDVEKNIRLALGLQ